MKPLPPYGKRLKKRMKNGPPINNGVNIYTSWHMGEIIPHGVTFPADFEPQDFDWSFLAGQEISLINTERYVQYKTLINLSVLLVESGVKSVGLIDGDHPLHWYVPETPEIQVEQQKLQNGGTG